VQVLEFGEHAAALHQAGAADGAVGADDDEGDDALAEPAGGRARAHHAVAPLLTQGAEGALIVLHLEPDASRLRQPGGNKPKQRDLPQCHEHPQP